MKKDPKSEITDVLSKVEEINKYGRELTDISRVSAGILNPEAVIEKEERIARLATNLVSTHASLIFYSGCGTECLEGKKPLYLHGLQDNAKKYLAEAKEFEYLPTIKNLSETLAAEVKYKEEGK